MKCKRLEELLELLGEHWRKQPDLHLIDILQQLSEEVGEPNNYPALRDEVLIYQLKCAIQINTSRFRALKKITKTILKAQFYVRGEF